MNRKAIKIISGLQITAFTVYVCNYAS